MRPKLNKNCSAVIVWLFEGTENGKGRIPRVFQTLELLLEGEQTGTVVFHVTCVWAPPYYNGFLCQAGISHVAHSGVALTLNRSRLIQWCHFVSPTQLTYTYENKYANRRVYSQMLLYSNEHSLRHCHLLLRTTLYKPSQLHPTFWQEATCHFPSPSLPEQESTIFQSKIETL